MRAFMQGQLTRGQVEARDADKVTDRRGHRHPDHLDCRSELGPRSRLREW
jgi:hypothetical protein